MKFFESDLALSLITLCKFICGNIFEIRFWKYALIYLFHNENTTYVGNIISNRKHLKFSFTRIVSLFWTKPFLVRPTVYFLDIEYFPVERTCL